MPNRNRKKVIIGYRYDPQSNSIDRLHELKAVDESDGVYDQNANSVKGRMHAELQIVRQLRNQSTFYNKLDLLLKAQIQRLQQKSSIQSYNMLAQSHQHLQNQCTLLKQQIQQLQQQLASLQSKYISLKGQKSTKHSSQQVPVSDKGDGWKYTFSPYHTSSVEEKDFYRREKSDQSAEKYPSFKELSITKKEMPFLNESLVNKILSERLLESEPERETSFAQLNNYQTLQKQVFKPNPSSLQYFQGMSNQHFRRISSEYLYNDLQTIESQKSQELESMVQLDMNFSFMPKRLKKNQPSVKVLAPTNKKVSFNEDVNLLYSEKDFSFSKNSLAENQSQPSLTAEIKTEEISSKSTLSGLKKLPAKPIRVQSTLSDSMKDL